MAELENDYSLHESFSQKDSNDKNNTSTHSQKYYTILEILCELMSDTRDSVWELRSDFSTFICYSFPVNCKVLGGEDCVIYLWNPMFRSLSDLKQIYK